MLKIVQEIAATEAKLARLRGEMGRAQGHSEDPFLFSRSERAQWKTVEAHGSAHTGYGEKFRNGKPTGEHAAIVRVNEKLSPSQLKRRGLQKVPSTLGRGPGRLKTDVVEGRFKRFRLDCQAGDGLESSADAGTLACFGVEDGTHRAVAFTAMHVSGLRRDFPEQGVPAPSFFSPAMGGTQVGRLLRGTRNGVDFAALALAIGARTNAPFITGFRPLVPDDLGTEVLVLGARGRTRGRIGEFMPVFNVSTLPFPLLNVVIVRLQQRTSRGDSGAAVIDQAGLVIGFHVGSAMVNEGDTEVPISVCCSAVAGLRRVGCTIPLAS